MKRDRALVFSVRKLEQGPNRFDVEPTAEYLGLREYHFLKPIRCGLVLTLTGRRVDLELELETSVEITCSQCGEFAPFEIYATSKATFLPEAEKKLEGMEVDSTDLEFYSEEIDLADIVRDAFILALPIAALCRDDCKGLCPSCGTNLNCGSCNCDQSNENS